MAFNGWQEVKAKDAEEIEEYIEQNGVSNIHRLLKSKLCEWQEVEVSFGLTGDSGTGKSSFINTVRDVADDDDRAAKVGVRQTTLKPTCFTHPTNPKIKFWDLPGIGTPEYENLETYCEKVPLKEYDAFLIFSSNRFTENDKQLSKKIRSMNKHFFFIRTHIDKDIQSEKRKKSFSGEDATLEEICSDCLENLHGLVRKEDIFLISNHHPAQWDFGRLCGAILDALPMHQRESLTLSLSALTSLSTDILKRKVEILQGRIWKVASLSAAIAVVPVPGVSILADLVLIHKEVSFYISQLGVPVTGTSVFELLSDKTKRDVTSIWSTMSTVPKIKELMKVFATEQTIEEFTRFIPFVGYLAAGAMSFVGTYYFLKQCLKNIESVALQVLKETTID